MSDTIYSWSLVADENGSADNEAPWPEGMPPSQVNNSARAVMSRVREFITDITGVAVDMGTSNALRVQSASKFDTDYPANYELLFKSSNTPVSEFTLSVNNLPELPVFKITPTGMQRAGQGDIYTTGIYQVIYIQNITSDTSGWYLVNPSRNSTESGAIMAFASRNAPSGWLVCNAATYEVSDYPILYGIIGRDWTGQSVPQTQFQVPDMRGKFIRGWNNGGSANPDQNRQWASYQEDQFKQHNHPGSSTNEAGSHSHGYIAPGNLRYGKIFRDLDSYVPSTYQGTTSEAGSHSHTLNITNDGYAETRPANYPFLYCIKT